MSAPRSDWDSEPKPWVTEPTSPGSSTPISKVGETVKQADSWACWLALAWFNATIRLVELAAPIQAQSSADTGSSGASHMPCCFTARAMDSMECMMSLMRSEFCWSESWGKQLRIWPQAPTTTACLWALVMKWRFMGTAGRECTRAGKAFSKTACSDLMMTTWGQTMKKHLTTWVVESVSCIKGLPRSFTNTWPWHPSNHLNLKLLMTTGRGVQPTMMCTSLYGKCGPWYSYLFSELW